MNTYSWLIRREFWENRAIWLFPAVLSGFLLLVLYVMHPHTPG